MIKSSYRLSLNFIRLMSSTKYHRKSINSINQFKNRPLKFYNFIVFFISITTFYQASVIDVQAGNWFVRPNGSSYGKNDGTDWISAFNGFSGISWESVSCGDTIWIAGGSYTQSLSPKKNCTSGSQLYIRRARSDSKECTETNGWSSSFNTNVVQYRQNISFGSYNYITISGKTAESGGQYGWLIDYTGLTSGLGITFPNGSTASYIQVEYIEIKGPNILGFTGDGRGIDDTPFASSTNHKFSHMKIWGWESGIYIAGTNNHISEYIEMYNIRSDGKMHPNLYYIIDSNNGTIRYSKFYNSAASGTGIAFSDGGPWNNWSIYGNIFFNMTEGYASAIGVQDAAISGLKIYNNTFSNNAMNINLSSASCGSGCETKNNLFYGSGGDIKCGTTSNNIIASSDPFVNRSGNNYRITEKIGSGYPRDKGVNLGTAYSIDMDGAQRGIDGTWDVGAFEYVSGAQGENVGPDSPKELKLIN